MLALASAALAMLACSDRPDQGSAARTNSHIELDQSGKVFKLETSLLTERSSAARLREAAAFATGALFAPLVDGAGSPLLASNGTRIRGSCGATFIAPSYAITAAHCVDGTKSDVQALVMEMYRPTAEIDEGFKRAASLSGSFPNFTHAALGATDGYFVDRYHCQVVSRCAGLYGGPVNCDSEHSRPSVESDTALVRCDGTPGLRYGFVTIATADDAGAEIFLPWKHEIYDLPSRPVSPTDDRWLHYTVAPANPADNYHYFGLDTAGVEQNQLLPLISVDYANGTPHHKLSATAFSVSTDLLGCQGTSGAGALQQEAEGVWQLLGPISAGNPEQDVYLCNHIPSLDGLSREPGTLGLSYMVLAATQYVYARNQSVIDADCDQISAGAAGAPAHLGCSLAGLRAAAAAPLAEAVVNTFDTMPERLGALLIDLATVPNPPQPMRFVGDGRAGFAARLLGDERMVVTRQAITAGRRWTARFTVSGTARITCGLVDGSGQVARQADCTSGQATLDDRSAPSESRGGFFIQTPGDTSAVEIDDLQIVSDAASDIDGDSIPDAVDKCPRGPLPPGGEALGVTLPDATFSVCAPEPALVVVPVPQLLNACEKAVLHGRLSAVNGRLLDRSVAVVPDSGQIVLPLGSHTISWEVQDAPGNIYATLTHTVTVTYDPGPQCCDRDQILTTGSAANDVVARGDAPAACVLAKTGDDFVVAGPAADWLSGGPGGDYIIGGGGADVLSGGDGNDYLAGGGGGVLTVYAGSGDDTVHARFAASARIFGGSGADVLVGSDGPDQIYPGPGTILVLAGNGDDVVTIYDACELSPGMRLDGGGGQDRLVAPVSRGELSSAGVRVEGFETVVVDATRAYLSECF